MKKLCTSVLAVLIGLTGYAQKFAYGTGTDLWGGSPSEKDYKEAKALGFDYIELAPGAYGGGTYEQIISSSQSTKTKLANAGVSVWSIHLPYGGSNDISVLDENTRLNTIARLKDYIKACAEVFHPKVMVLHPSAEPIPDSEREQRIVNAAASVGELYKTAQEAGVTLCVENLPRTCLGNTPEELLRIVEPTPGVKICFDTNHFLKGSTEHFIRTAGHLIGTVHISDFDYNDEKHWLPTLGKIAWGELMLQLEEAGYDGVFMSESEKTLDGKATIQLMKETYDIIFKEYEELKANPTKRLGAYLEGIRKQYFEDTDIASVFPAGTAPGFYPQNLCDAFIQVYNQGVQAAQENHTAEECAALRTGARDRMAELIASVNPVTDGYYFIVSGHSGFAERDKTMAMYTDASGLLKWQEWKSDLKYLFQITRLDNGLYSIQNIGTDMYINTIAGTSNDVPMSEKHTTDQIITSFNKMGQFFICNTANSLPYHTMRHNEGAGTGSTIVTWNGVAGSGSSWYLRPVDEETVQDLMKDKDSASDRLATFLETLNSIYFNEAPMEEVLPVGTDPGFFSTESYTAFKTVYDNAVEASHKEITTDEYIEQKNLVSHALDVLKASANPVTDGYYWLQSGHTGFTSAGKTVACYSDEDMTLKWKAFEEELPFLFHITALDNGNYSIRNMENKGYVHTVSGTSNNVPLTYTQQTEQVIEPFGLYGMLALYNTKNTLYYHIAGHQEGAGTSGEVVTWNGVAGSGSSWFLRSVPQTTVDKLLGTTNIGSTSANTANISQKGIYTLTGARVSDCIQTLPEGIYIIDGQKQVIHKR